MHDDARLDGELAAFTDRLLAGEDPPVSSDVADLAEVVRQLNAVIAPSQRPQSAYQDRLTQRLNREWTLQHQRRARFMPSRRLVQVAAVLALVVGALIVVSIDSSDEPVQGTALGSTSGMVVAVVVVIVVGILAFWYYQRRNL